MSSCFIYFYWSHIKPVEDLFTDPDYLRTLTLGQLGSRLEFTLHIWLHIRFSRPASEYRFIPVIPMPYIDEKWDDPSYDWLGDFYSAHLDPFFNKLHGWLDDRIEDWRIANNLTNITWKGTWMGGPSSVHHHLNSEDSGNDGNNGSENHHHSKNNTKIKRHDMEVMEEVIKILLKEGMCFSFIDNNDKLSLKLNTERVSDIS